MVDATPFLTGLSLAQGTAVIARFDGGRLSSEGGLLVLREVERRLELAERLAACLKDRFASRGLASKPYRRSAMTIAVASQPNLTLNQRLEIHPPALVHRSG